MSWLCGYLGNQPGDGSGASSRPSRNQPRVNYVEESEEDLEEGLIFDSPLTSPQRPHQSASVSPRVLLQPDPPLVEEVLEQVNNKLADSLQNSLRLEDDEEVVEGLVVGDDVEKDLNMPDNGNGGGGGGGQEPIVEYDSANTQDGDKAQDQARSIKMEFDKKLLPK